MDFNLDLIEQPIVVRIADFAVEVKRVGVIDKDFLVVGARAAVGILEQRVGLATREVAQPEPWSRVDPPVVVGVLLAIEQGVAVGVVADWIRAIGRVEVRRPAGASMIAAVRGRQSQLEPVVEPVLVRVPGVGEGIDSPPTIESAVVFLAISQSVVVGVAVVGVAREADAVNGKDVEHFVAVGKPVPVGIGVERVAAGVVFCDENTGEGLDTIGQVVIVGVGVKRVGPDFEFLVIRKAIIVAVELLVVGTGLGAVALYGLVFAGGVGAEVAAARRHLRTGGLEGDPAELVEVDLDPGVRVAGGNHAYRLALPLGQLAQREADDEPAREVVEPRQCYEGGGEVGALAAPSVEQEAVNRVLILGGVLHVEVIQVILAQMPDDGLRDIVVGIGAFGQDWCEVVDVVIAAGPLREVRQRQVLGPGRTDAGIHDFSGIAELGDCEGVGLELPVGDEALLRIHAHPLLPRRCHGD